MAKKEKKVVEGQEKKKNKKTLLWVGLGILAVGLLAFGATFALGLITLARDLAFTAIAFDTLLVGGTLGSVAMKGVINKKNAKKASKQQTVSRELERAKTLEEVPSYENGQQVILAPNVVAGKSSSKDNSKGKR